MTAPNGREKRATFTKSISRNPKVYHTIRELNWLLHKNDSMFCEAVYLIVRSDYNHVIDGRALEALGSERKAGDT
jgi:hypothetical protein